LAYLLSKYETEKKDSFLLSGKFLLIMDCEPKLLLPITNSTGIGVWFTFSCPFTLKIENTGSKIERILFCFIADVFSFMNFSYKSS
jgi:hypothetical protein